MGAEMLLLVILALVGVLVAALGLLAPENWQELPPRADRRAPETPAVVAAAWRLLSASALRPPAPAARLRFEPVASQAVREEGSTPCWICGRPSNIGDHRHGRDI